MQLQDLQTAFIASLEAVASGPTDPLDIFLKSKKNSSNRSSFNKNNPLI